MPLEGLTQADPEMFMRRRQGKGACLALTKGSVGGALKFSAGLACRSAAHSPPSPFDLTMYANARWRRRTTP